MGILYQADFFLPPGFVTSGPWEIFIGNKLYCPISDKSAGRTLFTVTVFLKMLIYSWNTKSKQALLLWMIN